MDGATKDREFVGGLARGIKVIQSFTPESPSQTLSQVAARTGLAPATARRALLTLIELGFVRQHQRRFILRSNVLELGAAYVNSMRLDELVQPHLDALNAEFGDAASFTVLSGGEVLYLAHSAMAGRTGHLRQRLGTRLPAHATSAGHVLLAHLPQPAQEAYLARASFPAFTPHTPTSAAALAEALAEVRRRGYAVVESVLKCGMIGVAVTVRDPIGRVFAALNCATDTKRARLADLIAHRVPALHRAAGEIAESIQRFPTLAMSIAD